VAYHQSPVAPGTITAVKQKNQVIKRKTKILVRRKKVIRFNTFFLLTFSFASHDNLTIFGSIDKLHGLSHLSTTKTTTTTTTEKLSEKAIHHQQQQHQHQHHLQTLYCSMKNLLTTLKFNARCQDHQINVSHYFQPLMPNDLLRKSIDTCL